ncbi:hypothetical protein [Azospirillum largimobile]
MSLKTPAGFGRLGLRREKGAVAVRVRSKRRPGASSGLSGGGFRLTPLPAVLPSFRPLISHQCDMQFYCDYRAALRGIKG